jgi:ankyrin repeat protein
MVSKFKSLVVLILLSTVVISSADARDLNSQLFKAINNHNIAQVRQLVMGGVNVNCPGINRTTPLIAASYSGETDIARYLLLKGANIEARDSLGRTALIAGALNPYGASPTLGVLLRAGANVNDADKDGDTAIFNCVLWNDVKSINLLIKYKANINAQRRDGLTVLMQSSKDGLTDVVKILIRHGVNVNATMDGGTSAIILARNTGHPDIVNLLKNAGAKR